MRRYAKLSSYITRQWRLLALIILITVASALTVALQPWPLKLLIDSALGDVPFPAQLATVVGEPGSAGFTPRLIGVAALASLMIFAFNAAMDAAMTWGWTLAGQRMVVALSSDIFQRLQRLSMIYHTTRSVGDTLGRLTADTWSIYTASSSLLVAPLRQFFVLFSVGAIAWSLNPRLALVSLAVAPLLGGSALYFGDRVQRRTRLNRESQSRVMSFVHQTLSSIPIVQAFDSRVRNVATFHRLAGDATGLYQKTVLLNTSSALLNGTITTTGTAVVLYLGAIEVLDGRLTLGSLLVFLAYLATLQTASQELLAVYTNFRGVSASMDRVLEILESSEMVEERAGAPALPRVRGSIGLEGITFGYVVDRPVVHDLTLFVEPGEVVAIVGPTGSGKSTLVGLVPRFFDPWSGRVTLDGQDVRDVTVASVRAQVALVLQEPFLLPVSIAENIAYGRPDATEAEIEAAARAANAHGFISRLPDGYGTVLAERGLSLSGGERQRLSIARALLKDAPILILDEPTSALDAETEALLLDALERLMQGRTTLIIAHRLTTIRRANRIVVITDGRIAEQGGHNELLALGGTYAALYHSQFKVRPSQIEKATA